MAVDLPLDGEQLVSFKKLAKSLPESPGYHSLRRWANVGFRGAMLEQRRLGGRYYSSVNAVRRFMAQTQPGS